MPRLLDAVREATRRLHYSIRTEEAYASWVKRFVLFHGKRHPDEMGEPEVVAFLNHLATDRDVAASTQNQALNAILFLDKVVLDRPLEWFDDELVRAKRPARLPVVLTREAVRALIGQLDGPHRLAASLLYGAGLRLLECLRLRVKDVDYGQNHLVVRDGKGQRDRVALLPATLADGLRGQIDRAAPIDASDSARASSRRTTGKFIAGPGPMRGP